MTKREAILQAFGTLLSNVSGITVYRSRVNAFLRGEAGANTPVHFTWTRDNVVSETFPYIDWNLTIKVSFIGREEGADSSIDDAAEAVYQTIMQSEGLNGLCIDITPNGADYTAVQGDNEARVVSFDFIATYRVLREDIGS